MDSLYGNLPSLGTAAVAGPAPPPAGEVAGPAGPPKKASGDDIFAEPAKKAGGKDDGSSSAPTASKEPGSLPQTFTAAKLMMPPVRKRAEPVKRSTMPALDLSKLKEEKEALLRQQASAAKKKEEAKPAAPSGFVSSSTPSAPPVGFSAASAAAADAAGDSSTAVVSSSSLYGSPDEEYDPAKPNDYDEFCRRRLRQKAEEEMERRRQEAIQRTQAAAKPPEPKEDDFATRMMKKMGWKEGQGLGSEGQGRTAPLIMKKVDHAAAVITEGLKREGPPVAAPPAAKQAKPAEAKQRPPTRVLLLNNLVGAGDADEDLEEETAEEAGKYGKLVKCVVKEIKGLPDTEAVRIFLEFEKVESSTKALIDMNGRYFGGRVVKARFFDEARFAAGDLGKKDDE